MHIAASEVGCRGHAARADRSGARAAGSARAARTGRMTESRTDGWWSSVGKGASEPGRAGSSKPCSRRGMVSVRDASGGGAASGRHSARRSRRPGGSRTEHLWQQVAIPNCRPQQLVQQPDQGCFDRNRCDPPKHPDPKHVSKQHPARYALYGDTIPVRGRTHHGGRDACSARLIACRCAASSGVVQLGTRCRMHSAPTSEAAVYHYGDFEEVNLKA
jgi:hypothetical protein